MLAAQEVFFSECSQKMRKKKIYLNLKNRYLIYEKSEKLTFEISIWVKTRNQFFRKMRVRATGCKFYLGVTKRGEKKSSLSRSE